MRIRSKLLMMMAIPLVALVVVAAFGFRQQASRAGNADDAIVVVETVEVYNDAAVAVGDERLAQLGAQGAIPIDEAMGNTDAAIEALARQGRNTADASVGTQAAALQQAVTTARESTANVPAMVAAYESAVWTVVGQPLDATSFPSAETYNLASVDAFFMEGVSMREQTWFNYLTSTTLAEAIEPVTLSSQFAMSNGTIFHSSVIAPEAVQTEIRLLGTSPSGQELGQLETLALDGLGSTEIVVSADQVLPTLVDFRNEWSADIDGRQQALLAIVEGDRQNSSDLQSLFTLAAILGLIVLGGLIFVIYRSIATPLESLLERADEVANRDLPELVYTLRASDVPEDLPTPRPIVSESSDEIGDLVDAFNEVQITAYDLATEQALGRRNVAEMFVNLGRRNQQLLQRIISKLTELQNDEEDPDKLRELFVLDNVVTRMRRNAESLLVLAGSSTPRQWSKPVSIENTVRAALGEVEGYERVDIAALADAELKGTVVADVAHLLAELLENALNFSDPSTNVLVSGHAENGGYLVSVFDQGIGMSPEELVMNNERITNPPPLDQAPTRFLGLFVVGRLGDRHNINVRLVEAPGRGVMARIEIPADLLAAVSEDDHSELPEIAAMVVAAEETSPLSENLDLDEEMAALTESATLEQSQSDFVEAPVAPVAQDQSSDTAGELPPLPTRGASSQPVADGELPTRGAAGADSASGLPTRARPESAAATAVAEPVEMPIAEMATQPGATPSATVDGGLPTRSRGNAFQTEATAPVASDTDQKTPAPETKDASAQAGQFSSLMSAFSSGVNRGLDDATNDASAEPTQGEEYT